MIATILSVWATSWPQVADHIWQSTLFAGAAALVALALKQHQARARYWIWMAASVKFLVPFSLLVVLGSHLGWTGARPIARPAVSVADAVVVVSQPFSRPSVEVSQAPAATLIAPSEPVATPSRIPSVLLTLWMAGCLAVVLARGLSWRRVSRAIRSAAPSRDGRELDALRRVGHAAGLRTPVPLLRSDSALEPAVVGVFTSALLWPAVISDELDDAQMEAILAHELSHVQRRDNLAAALHMVVETVFWFHPVVWWITSRLVDARERACDEAVIAHGADPQAYAEGILKVCRLCLASPLPCVGGVTGSNLTKRIEQIMTDRPARVLKLGKKLLLSALAVAVVSGPIVIGLTHPISVRAQSAIDTLISPVAESVPTAAPAEPPVPEQPAAAARSTRANEPALPAPLAMNAVTDASVLLQGSRQQLPQPPPILIPAGSNIRITIIPDPNNWSRDYAVAQSDGAITFPDLGHIVAAGKTTREIETLISQELVRREFFSRPPWSVVVEVVPARAIVRGQRVYISGEIRTPGVVSLTADRMTLSSAIIAAGGYQPTAGTSVTVVRPLRSGMGIVTDVNVPNIELHQYVREALERTGADPAIQEGDTIIVSRAEVYYINGEIRSTGEKIWRDGTTLGDALAAAGGMTDKGSLGRSFIRRKNAQGEFKEIANLKLETPILPKDEIVIRKKLF